MSRSTPAPASLAALLLAAAGLAVAGVASFSPAVPAGPAPAKRIAFLIESWYPRSHADVIGTRLMEGYRVGGVARASAVTIAAVYADQPRADDQTRTVATRYGFKVATSVAEALLEDPRAPSPRLAVDGIFVGTREDPPRSRQLSSPTPRLQTFREILRIFDLTHTKVPVFFDKMVAANWQDSLTIVAEARRRGIPLMGGSVLSYMPLDRPLPSVGGVELGAVAASGPYGAYAFHAAEILQTVMEKRGPQEGGVTSLWDVGPGLWSLPDRDRWGAGVVDAMLRAAVTTGGRRGWSPGEPNTRVILIQYADGARGVLALLPRAFDDSEFVLATRRGGAVAVGGVQFRGPPFDHFGYLAQALGEFYVSGRPVVPVERTLLTTGIVLLGQLAGPNAQVDTPSLAITYTPPR